MQGSLPAKHMHRNDTANTAMGTNTIIVHRVCVVMHEHQLRLAHHAL
jgi:hypothetical protein